MGLAAVIREWLLSRGRGSVEDFIREHPAGKQYSVGHIYSTFYALRELGLIRVVDMTSRAGGYVYAVADKNNRCWEELWRCYRSGRRVRPA